MKSIPTERYGAFDAELSMYPVWKGDFVWQESVLFCETEDGSLPRCKLLYRPTKLLSVRDFERKNELCEGKDFRLEGDEMVLLPQSAVKPLDPRTYTQTKETLSDGWPTVFDNVYWRPCGYEELQKHALYVTYEAAGVWEGPLPEDDSKHLPRFFERLQSGQDCTLLWYGDSQLYGADASGTNDFAPFMPPFAQTVTEYIGKRYPNAHLCYKNTAVGGTRSDWGLENVKERVIDEHPDVVFLKFGSNEVWRPKEEYKELTKQIISAVHEACPETEFCLLSPFAHNEQCAVYATDILLDYEDAHRELQREMDAHIAVLSVYPAARWLVQKKGYLSMTTNMINHVGDFGCSVNGQLVLKALGLL